MRQKWKYVIRIPPETTQNSYAWEKTGIRHVTTWENRARTVCGMDAPENWRFSGFTNCATGVTCEKCCELIRAKGGGGENE